MQDARSQQAKNGEAPCLNHLCPYTEHRLQCPPALHAIKRSIIFRPKIHLRFKRQPAVEVPIESAAETRVLFSAGGTGQLNRRILRAELQARVGILRTEGSRECEHTDQQWKAAAEQALATIHPKFPFFTPLPPLGRQNRPQR